MPDAEKLISIIIPVYNPGKHLYRCLDSIVTQTYQNLEIILIDDGSTDGSSEVCDEYAARDSRVVCVHQPNGGVSKARNKGLSIAHGDYYSFPDSDDYLEPDSYAYLLQRMEEHQADAVNFEYYVTYSSHETVHKLSEKYYGLFDTEGAHRVVLAGEPFCCNKLYAKKLIEGLRFREDIFRGEDSLFAHYALEKAERVWFDQRPLYHYVQSEESACRGTFRSSQLSALKLYDAYETLYKEKYPNLYRVFLAGMPDLLITLYYDMWSDQNDYKIEQKNLKKKYNDNYVQLDKDLLNGKKRMKYFLFYLTPKVFCLIHKTIHRL